MESDWRPFERGLFGRLFKSRYAMRRKSAGKWEYRSCTAEEFAAIRDMVEKNRKSDDLAKQGTVVGKRHIVK